GAHDLLVLLTAPPTFGGGCGNATTRRLGAGALVEGGSWMVGLRRRRARPVLRTGEQGLEPLPVEEGDDAGGDQQSAQGEDDEDRGDRDGAETRALCGEHEEHAVLAVHGDGLLAEHGGAGLVLDDRCGAQAVAADRPRGVLAQLPVHVAVPAQLEEDAVVAAAALVHGGHGRALRAPELAPPQPP